MNVKCCPLLIQSDTRRSLTIEGEYFTRTYIIKCVLDKCAAYANGHCKKFDTEVICKGVIANGTR